MVQDDLVEVVVLPCPANLQILRGHTDLFEAGFEQHPLRAGIVQQGARLDAVQSKFRSCRFDDCLDRR